MSCARAESNKCASHEKALAELISDPCGPRRRKEPRHFWRTEREGGLVTLSTSDTPRVAWLPGCGWAFAFFLWGRGCAFGLAASVRAGCRAGRALSGSTETVHPARSGFGFRPRTGSRSSAGGVVQDHGVERGWDVLGTRLRVDRLHGWGVVAVPTLEAAVLDIGKGPFVCVARKGVRGILP